MSLGDLASLGSFVSGVAVVITLIFLVLQMRQNTAAVKAAASQAHVAVYQEITNIIVTDADFARVWWLAMTDMGQLSDTERVRFIAYLSSVFRFMESARWQWRHGQLDDEHWHALESDFKDLASQSGIKSYWALRRHQYPDQFRKWFESLPQTTTAPTFYGAPKSDQTASTAL